jgi:hypothetical protein
MSPESIQSLIAVAIGFSVGGLFASGFRLITRELPSVNLLQVGGYPAKVAAVPLLVFSAPFLIIRNTLLDRGQETFRFELVFMATLLSGFWSLASGTVVVMVLRVTGLLDA